MTRNKGIPDRWLAYKKMGKRVAGTPFIAFKVPLAEKYHRLLRKSERFSPAELVESNPGMRLIIDLTNTQRYYSAESVECKGVNYYKLACPGRVVPTESLVTRFCDVVHDFLSACSNGQDALIGVHCTHGVNRTGFLICSFMVRHLLMHPSEAVNAFESARGHHIERKEYLESLMIQYSMSGAGRKRKIPAHGPPPTVSEAIPDNAEDQSVMSYGFGTLRISTPSATTGSWTITTGSSHKTWKSKNANEAQGYSEGTGLDPEAGPSRKRGPNESFAPSRGHRKGKKDKRSKRNNGQSTSSTEGEDVRSDCSVGAQASGNNREVCANANRDKYHQREDPAYGSPRRQKTFSSSSPLDPPSLQHQLQQDPSLSPPSFPPLPPPPSPFPHAYAAQRGFGIGVERERDSGTGPASSWRGGFRGRGCGRGGDGGDSGGWGRGRGRGRDWDKERSRGRGRVRGGSGNSWGDGNHAWDRAGGREQGERFGQRSGRGWHRSHQRRTYLHHNSSYSRSNE